jgi:hypothetical protein
MRKTDEEKGQVLKKGQKKTKANSKAKKKLGGQKENTF